MRKNYSLWVLVPLERREGFIFLKKNIRTFILQGFREYLELINFLPRVCNGVKAVLQEEGI